MGKRFTTGGVYSTLDMENKTDNPLLLILAWLNYFVSYVLSVQFLNKFALILSILGSIVYIYTAVYKHINNKKV